MPNAKVSWQVARAQEGTAAPHSSEAAFPCHPGLSTVCEKAPRFREHPIFQAGILDKCGPEPG